MLWRSVRQYKMGLRETFKVYCNHMNKHAIFLASPFIKIGTWGSSFVEATFQLNTKASFRHIDKHKIPRIKIEISYMFHMIKILGRSRRVLSHFVFSPVSKQPYQ